eukprot:GILI01006875.1.p1 GENE.GILI01006875.1~~GILI01006875.1.p1  ORF type:complete len:237 (-),score=64.04 GILI01006875.1:602-1270(-)
MGLKQIYLVSYNVILCVGWAGVLTKIALHYAKGGDVTTVYPGIRELLVVSQTAAVMEILHAASGLVRSPLGTTFAQVFSRIFVLWGGLELGSKDVTQSYFVTQMVIAWSLSEIIRYSFYAINLIKGKVPAFLQWIRYSAFMILYPMGISGEMMTMYKALPYIAEKQSLSISLPNRYNFAFNYYGFVVVSLALLYPLGTYVLYGYMLSQRKKVIGGAKKEKKE